MSFGILLGVTVAATLGLVTTRVLARLATHLGWVDRPDTGRKTQGRPVPPVGGVVVLIGLAAGLALAGEAEREWVLGGAVGLPAWAGAGALLLAFAVGSIDDLVRGGLRPRAKFLGQLIACLPLGAGFLVMGTGSLGPAAALAGLALVAGVFALNVSNTFDNADGALTGLGVLGLALPAPVAAAALLGFLPSNLDGRRGSRTPTAYLGDAGSHVVGLLLLLQPLAWPVLLVPAADLLRVSVLRTRAGSRPWIGDRRHLAHGLAARGLTPRAVAAALVGIAAPACAGALLGGRSATGLGLSISIALFAAAVHWGRPVAAPRSPRAGPPRPIPR